VGVEIVHDHTSLTSSDSYGGFIFVLTIFSITNDYAYIGEISNELRVAISWPKVRVSIIMQGLAFL